MSWFWHIWWGAIAVWAIYFVGSNIGMIGIAQVNIEKERNRRADVEAADRRRVKTGSSE